jgi:hypothetical protein
MAVAPAGIVSMVARPTILCGLEQLYGVDILSDEQIGQYNSKECSARGIDNCIS